MYCETKYGVKGFWESGGINPLIPLGKRVDGLIMAGPYPAWEVCGRSDNGRAYPPLLGPFRAFSLNPPHREGHRNLLTNENRVMSTTMDRTAAHCADGAGRGVTGAGAGGVPDGRGRRRARRDGCHVRWIGRRRSDGGGDVGRCRWRCSCHGRRRA